MCGWSRSYNISDQCFIVSLDFDIDGKPIIRRPFQYKTFCPCVYQSYSTVLMSPLMRWISIFSAVLVESRYGACIKPHYHIWCFHEITSVIHCTERTTLPVFPFSQCGPYSVKPVAVSKSEYFFRIVWVLVPGDKAPVHPDHQRPLHRTLSPLLLTTSPDYSVPLPFRMPGEQPKRQKIFRVCGDPQWKQIVIRQRPIICWIPVMV